MFTIIVVVTIVHVYHHSVYSIDLPNSCSVERALFGHQASSSDSFQTPTMSCTSCRRISRTVTSPFIDGLSAYCLPML